MTRSCPPGVLCLSGGWTTVIILLCTIFVLLMFGSILFRQANTTIVMPEVRPAVSPPVTVIQRGGDSRYERAPQPLRDWMATPEIPRLSALPFNIPTQGLPESFQSVGVINVGEQVLPLYGRRTTGGSDRWNYYTRTDTYNPVPIPVRFQKRDCMDDVGCSEILSGEHVKVEALQKDGKASIYRFDGPKYIPGLL
jgi:hypothetical protein